MTKLFEKVESANEYKYRLRVRPFGIGCQPDGHIRFEDDGSQFGVVVYDHRLSSEDARHFSLAPLTEANELNGKVYVVPFGPTKLNLRVVSTDNAIIEVIANDEHKMSFSYYDFIEEIANATIAES